MTKNHRAKSRFELKKFKYTFELKTGIFKTTKRSTDIYEFRIRCWACRSSIRWSWAPGLLSYQRPPSAGSPLQVMQQVSAGIQLLSRGQKSAVNWAQSSYSGWVTNWSRQLGGFGDLLSSLGITGERYTDWSHNKLTTTPPLPTSPLPSPPCTQWAEGGAARKGWLVLLGLFSFGELRYCARVRRSDSSGQAA